MQYEKLFELLARSDVKELAFQSDRPPCALVGAQYTPVVARNLTEDEIIALLVQAGGRAEVLHLIEGHRRWDYNHPTLGALRISAGYHDALLQVRIHLVNPEARPAKNQRPTGVDAGRSAKSSVSTDLDEPPARPRSATFEPAENKRKPATFDFDAPVPQAAAEPFDFGDMPPLSSAREAAVAARKAKPASWPAPPPKATPTAARSPLEDLFDEPANVGGGPFEPANDAGGEADFLPVPDSMSSAPAMSAMSDEDMFEYLLKLTRAKKASDLHILSDRPPMLRIAGDLVPQGSVLAHATVEAMLLPAIPESARADLDKHGSCDFALVHKAHGRFRANITRQRSGYKLTARPVGERVPSLADLGLPDSIELATHHHQGLIVVTGPTGHGKTTTLAAIVDIINRAKTHHIITVEDPIEYVHPRHKSMISQREVGTHTKTFQAALKGSLREDPDVIVVGELRDTETVRMALSASETGHLVISTMNTPSAAKAIERIIDLFPPGDQPQVRMTLAGGLRLIVSQRLVPTADRKGVVAAVELLPGTPALWALIRDGKTFQIPSLQQRGKALGIIRLDDSLADLVKRGLVSAEVAREFAEAPDQFEALVSGRGLRPMEQPLTAANIDPTKEAAAAAQKFGKDMLSKAGKLFGNEKK